jgi:NADH-quinone oxidoreductase subunit J
MSWGLAIWAGALALAAAVAAVTRDSVVHALLFLLGALVALGVAFFALAAPFAGAIQLLIYAGAVVAVFVFVVMTVEAGPEARARERALLAGAWRWPALVAALAFLPILVGLGRGGPGTPGPAGAAELGLLMFGNWAVATELVSLLLIAGMIGVRALGRKRSAEDRASTSARRG